MKRNSKTFAIILTVIFSLLGIHGIGYTYLKKYKFGTLFFSLSFMPFIIYFSWLSIDLWMAGMYISSLTGLYDVMFTRGFNQYFWDHGMDNWFVILKITLTALQVIHIYRMELKYKQSSLL